ncbi:DUF2934 domain-containing protein [Nitrosomonas sp.]|uniref:DUF2934 domain-containing protein n=1 Tax=Nitrosomonas sp. TaxID=42353 RepID=UPI001D906B85|nr:DUF2934 domain-containing protein [Nitrosomonas sp.]MCB1948673.1 DUF2934 domain-containing protein [Nitrosomonas sp.]
MDAAKQQTKSTMRTKKELSSKDKASESELNEQDRDSRVAVSAYYKAQARGFEPGHELEDWLAAEAEENQ